MHKEKTRLIIPKIVALRRRGMKERQIASLLGINIRFVSQYLKEVDNDD